MLKELADAKKTATLVNMLGEEERELLRRAVDNPDALYAREAYRLWISSCI